MQQRVLIDNRQLQLYHRELIVSRHLSEGLGYSMFHLTLNVIVVYRDVIETYRATATGHVTHSKAISLREPLNSEHVSYASLRLATVGTPEDVGVGDET